MYRELDPWCCGVNDLSKDGFDPAFDLLPPASARAERR